MTKSALDQWLANFKNYWLEKDIEAVLNLFSDDVEYWETPFKRLTGKEEIKQEWSYIRAQKNIELEFSVLVETENTNVVKWQLVYDFDSKKQTWSGMYVIKMNDSGRCNYFYQVGEKV